MKIRVRLAGHLSGYATARDVTVDVAEGASVADLIAALGIPGGEVGTLYLDGTGALVDAPLRDGCTVELFPPIAGGSRAVE